MTVTNEQCVAIVDHWLNIAHKMPSPNFNQRPENVPVSLLVIHNISLPPGEFGGGYVQQFFQNRLDSAMHPYFESIAALQVSAHLFIERDGKITQFVSFADRAWHAGISSFEGVPNCNDYSIGIEMEGTDDQHFTDIQYEQLAKVTRHLLLTYPTLTLGRITGHEHIASGRKTDPGPYFDWSRYFALITPSRC
ncbi:MAG TPA: 1,6-anhydro-N-acetylmuramyl-L-alanine amidase AmpD [Cellvibrio sp.]|nr:1,6-anhydro-N-acetylmuramyl-L-alanine amidase AmpD [Cellvibrio sp.]